MWGQLGLYEKVILTSAVVATWSNPCRVSAPQSIGSLAIWIFYTLFEEFGRALFKVMSEQEPVIWLGERLIDFKFNEISC